MAKDVASIPFDPESLLPMELVPMRVDAHVGAALLAMLRPLSPAKRQLAYRAILDYRIRAKREGIQQDSARWVEDYRAAIAAALEERRETAPAV